MTDMDDYYRKDKKSKVKMKNLGKTFASKFLFELLKYKTNPMILLIQILQFKLENRKKEEIDKIIPIIKTLKNFNAIVSLNENEKDYNNFLKAFTWILFYKSINKFYFLKRNNEDNEYFYILLNGSVTKLGCIYNKENITIEDYLLYIIKLKLLNENNILKILDKLNKKAIKIDSVNNLENYFKNNKNYNYNKLKNIAISDLNDLGFNLNETINRVPDVNRFINAFSLSKKLKQKEGDIKFYLYLPHYEIMSNYYKGDYIGDFKYESSDNNYIYICTEYCDLCFFNKLKNNDNNIYSFFTNKLQNLIPEGTKNYFFMFKSVTEESFKNFYIPLMEYKKFKKGDKIFLQNSNYDGMYLILSGEIKLTVNVRMDDVQRLIISLSSGLFSFKDYISSIKIEDLLNTNGTGEEELVNNPICLKNEFIKKYRGLKVIDLYTMKKGEVLGLYETFDSLTGLYNLNAICDSEEAILLYIPKNKVDKTINRENCVREAVIQLYEFKVKNLTGVINSFKKNLILSLINMIKLDINENKPNINKSSESLVNFKNYSNLYSSPPKTVKSYNNFDQIKVLKNTNKINCLKLNYNNVINNKIFKNQRNNNSLKNFTKIRLQQKEPNLFLKYKIFETLPNYMFTDYNKMVLDNNNILLGSAKLKNLKTNKTILQKHENYNLSNITVSLPNIHTNIRLPINLNKKSAKLQRYNFSDIKKNKPILEKYQSSEINYNFTNI